MKKTHNLIIKLFNRICDDKLLTPSSIVLPLKIVKYAKLHLLHRETCWMSNSILKDGMVKID